MQDNRDGVAPTLPTELLRSIFLSCVSDDSTDNVIPRPSHTSVPLNLSWVNRQWREVALSTPELWTSIALPNARARSTNPNPDPTYGDTEILKLYISRSGDELPLSFALDYGGLPSEERKPGKISRYEETGFEGHVAGIHCLTLIMDGVRHRWRVVVVRCRTPEALDILLSSLVLGAPMLEHLLISTTPQVFTVPRSETESDCPQVDRMLDPARCPELKSIVLQCSQLQVNPFLPDDGLLENLTSLAISNSTSQSDALTWLQCGPNLETLSIQFINAPPFALPHALPLALPRLTRFTLICLSGADQEVSDPTSFLHLLTLPELRTFELYMDGSLGSNQGWPHVLDFLRRSGPGPNAGPPLGELELLGTPVSTSELLDTLQLVPGLKKLTIDDALTSDEVLHRLNGSEYADTRAESEGAGRNSSVDSNHHRLPLCPELETLVLHACSASLPVLESTASSRCCRIPRTREEGLGDGSPEDALSGGTSDAKPADEQRYGTLKTLELIHSYNSLPPISENPMFVRCQEDGLKVVQRPRPIPRT